MDACNGTKVKAWVMARNTPKAMKKCQVWLTIPMNSILTRYSTPQANMMGREPNRSPIMPATGDISAPMR